MSLSRFLPLFHCQSFMLFFEKGLVSTFISTLNITQGVFLSANDQQSCEKSALIHVKSGAGYDGYEKLCFEIQLLPFNRAVT